VTPFALCYWQSHNISVSEEKPQPKSYNRDALNDFSRRYADFIFTRHPEWEQYAIGHQSDSTRHGSLDISIPSPSGDPELKLLICTDDGEVTCYFDYHHVHFSAWGDNDTYDNIFSSSSEWLQEFMDEKIKIVVYMKDGQWTETSCADAHEVPKQKAENQVYTKSWRGTYSKDHSKRTILQRLFNWH
jgi:hypothetical protein